MTIKELEEYGTLTALYYELNQTDFKEADKKKLKEVKRRLAKISDFILGCTDPLIKQLMILRFTRFLSWEEVAIEIGGYNSSGSCRMLVIRYINRENRKKLTTLGER